jgi:hypothetical protein
MNDMLRMAKLERQRLEAQLADSPVYRRLEAVKRLIELYEADAAEARPVMATTQATSTAVARLQRPHGARTSAITAAAEQYLRQKGNRATSGEILRVLNAQGIDVGGKKPSATLASYLSNSKDFDNVAGQGYGLVVWAGRPPRAGAETETPDSGQLSGAPVNGSLPLNS